MSYDRDNRRIDVKTRPQFIITDPMTMQHPVAMLHHRVDWKTLCGALNGVLSGTVDVKVVKSLLQLSPVSTGPVIEQFKAAMTQVRAGKLLVQAQIDAIERVERLIFTLPCNLFQGLNDRDDDPGDGGLDFLPGDVNSDGTLPREAGQLTLLGQAQKLRETLFAKLQNPNQALALADIDKCCDDLAKVWAMIKPAAPAVAATPQQAAIPVRTPLQQATGFQLNQWVQGDPGFRSWQGPNGQLTAKQSKELNAVVKKRALTA